MNGDHHYLVLTWAEEPGSGTFSENLDWNISHPPACEPLLVTINESFKALEFQCAIQHEVDWIGVDAFGLNEAARLCAWSTVPAVFPIEFFHEVIRCANGTEHDVGIRLAGGHVVSGDDIVERLRRAADTSSGGGGEWYQLVHRCRDAADAIEELTAERDASRLTINDLTAEVERLRAERDEHRDAARAYKAEIERLRAAGDAMAHFIRSEHGLTKLHLAAYAWEEARRG